MMALEYQMLLRGRWRLYCNRYQIHAAKASVSAVYSSLWVQKNANYKFYSTHAAKAKVSAVC